MLIVDNIPEVCNVILSPVSNFLSFSYTNDIFVPLSIETTRPRAPDVDPRTCSPTITLLENVADWSEAVIDGKVGLVESSDSK